MRAKYLIEESPESAEIIREQYKSCKSSLSVLFSPASRQEKRLEQACVSAKRKRLSENDQQLPAGILSICVYIYTLRRLPIGLFKLFLALAAVPFFPLRSYLLQSLVSFFPRKRENNLYMRASLNWKSPFILLKVSAESFSSFGALSYSLAAVVRAFSLPFAYVYAPHSHLRVCTPFSRLSSLFWQIPWIYIRVSFLFSFSFSLSLRLTVPGLCLCYIGKSNLLYRFEADALYLIPTIELVRILCIIQSLLLSVLYSESMK